MKDQIEIVKDVAEGMYGIGGIPSNEEFYAEFDMRVRLALQIEGVAGQSEQLKAFNDWFQQNGQLFEWGIDESVIDYYLKSL